MENYTIQEKLNTNLLPLIPLRGKVAFPHTTVSFEVGRDMTLKALERATSTDRTVFICTQRDTAKDTIESTDLYTVGSVAKIKQIAQLTGGIARVVCECLYRAEARSISFENGSFTAVVGNFSSSS